MRSNVKVSLLLLLASASFSLAGNLNGKGKKKEGAEVKVNDNGAATTDQLPTTTTTTTTDKSEVIKSEVIEEAEESIFDQTVKTNAVTAQQTRQNEGLDTEIPKLKIDTTQTGFKVQEKIQTIYESTLVSDQNSVSESKLDKSVLTKEETRELLGKRIESDKLQRIKLEESMESRRTEILNLKTKIASTELVGSEKTADDILLAKWQAELDSDEATLKTGDLQLAQREATFNAKNSLGFFEKGVKYRNGKIFGSVLIGVTVVSFIVWGIATGWFDRVAHPNQPQTPVIAEVIKHESSTKTMLQEACVEMQSAAVRFEGNAREMYPGGKYENMLTALEPVWIVAYEEASRYINGNLSALPIVGWGASAPLPVLPYVSNHASVADSAKIAKQVEQDLDQHALNEFARPFYLHQQFSQQHIEAIDEAAFQSIVNAQKLSFSTHSDLFYKAYTGMYSVLDISRECYPYIHEDKATRARYKQLRAIQTVRDANTEAILDGIFDARSALPAIEPLPAVQATA